MCWIGKHDLWFLFIILEVVCAKKVIWKYDSDISNRDNWVGGDLAQGCKGLHFAAVNTAPILIQRLVTAEMTLPTDGDIVFDDNAFIEFRDNKKCINLKPIDFHDFYDPDSWLQTDTNSAIPDKEKIPCENDDVIFPNIKYSHVTTGTSNPIKVGSVKFNKTGKNQEVPLQLFQAQPKTCHDPFGCICHSDSIFCPSVSEGIKHAKCKEPVIPEDSCHEICGAYVTYNVGKGPKLQDVHKKLKDYQVDTHASRVKDYLGADVVQVVFSEKEYTGRSVQDAEDFVNYLKSSEAGSVQFFKSGEFYVEGGTNPWSIVFGSLAVVLAFFGLVFYAQGKGSVRIVIDRFNTARGSIFSAPFFARFDNIDENLIIDGQSEHGSILDIAKSFDNPLYGQEVATHESPLYEVTKEEAEE